MPRRLRKSCEEFDGPLDDVRIYGRALSDAEVRALASPVRKLIGHWELDESAGTSAPDSSGNGLVGTLLSGPTWQPTGGPVLGALEFDGSDDCVEVPYDISLYPAYSVTVATWIRPAHR